MSEQGIVVPVIISRLGRKANVLPCTRRNNQQLTLMRCIQLSVSSYANTVAETPAYLQHLSIRLFVPWIPQCSWHTVTLLPWHDTDPITTSSRHSLD